MLRYYYAAMTLHAQGSTAKTAEALEVLHKACDKDPKNPQVGLSFSWISICILSLSSITFLMCSFDFNLLTFWCPWKILKGL